MRAPPRHHGIGRTRGTSLWRRAATRGGDAGVGETLPFLFGFAVNLKPLWKSRLKNKNNPATRNRWKAAIAKCGRGGDTESVTRTSRRPVSPRGVCGLSADAVPALRTDRRGDRGGGERARPCEGGVLGWAAPQGRQAGHGPGPAGPLGRAAGPEHALYF